MNISFLQLVTVSQRVLQMTVHVCRKLHSRSSLGSVSVRTTYLDGSVITVFQVTGDTEGIHLENAEVSFPFFNCSLRFLNQVFVAPTRLLPNRSPAAWDTQESPLDT